MRDLKISDFDKGMRRIQRRLLISIITLISLFTVANTCAGHRFYIPDPLTGEYSGLAISAAQSLNGVTVTVTAKTYGWERCEPSFGGNPELDWSDLMTIQENDDGEFAFAWASGSGDHLTGSQASLGCFWGHSLLFQAYNDWRDAKGDFGNNDHEEPELCVDIRTGVPLPCIF